jgi:hypothetical protein
MSITPIKKYFIVSLPRTGTKSLCRMVHELGFAFKHVPAVALPRLLNENKIQVFADTPVFTPSTFKELVPDENNLFIYINRDINDWLDSFERVNLHNNYMALHTGKIAENAINKMDRECLEEIFNNQDYTKELALCQFKHHYNVVTEVIPKPRLLVYSFDMGWGPLCEFMGVPEPDLPIPQINKNTMFDPIVKAH